MLLGFVAIGKKSATAYLPPELRHYNHCADAGTIDGQKGGKVCQMNE